MERISKQINAGKYTLSIQRSDKHLCDDSTYEVAVMHRNKIIVPD